MTWSFGDPTGWTIACILFFVWSSLIGLGIHAISYRLLTMGFLDQTERPSRRVSVTLGTVVAMAVFSALYYTSLRGFTQLDLRDDELTFRYILPDRTTSLPFYNVTTVQEEPAHKSQWRLILITDSSGTFESVLASRREVHQAGNILREQLVSRHSLQP